MNPLRPLAPLLLLLLTVSHSPAADTPEDIVGRQIAAMRDGDWEKFTSCMSEATLKEFQNSVIETLKAAPESGNRQQILHVFFGDKSVGDLTAVKPADFFGIFMNGLRETNPILKDTMAKAEGKVIGHVDEGPNTTHVLVRMVMPLGNGRMTKMDVTTLQRDGDTWKAQLKSDMQAVVNNFNRMLQPR